ncbi:MAG: hypothetical protein MUD12_01085 [Spirochaetes bacterium]|jgi:hypothetical protein|nr:hypothetical protein [Spirochaetota bacterium]
MKSKYLSFNPINWLLEKSDPCSRFLTLRDLVGDGNHLKEYDTLATDARIKKIYGLSDNWILGNKKHFDLYYHGSMWCFSESVALGMDRRTDFIEKTAEFIMERAQNKDGGFTLNWTPPISTACRTGDMLKHLILCGYDDERIKKGIEWILERQRHDGGWLHCPLSGGCDYLKLTLFNKSGKGLLREKNKNVKSCIYATLSCAYALQLYKKNKPGFDSNALPAAAEFFLSMKLFKDSKGNAIKPNRGWNRDFRLLGLPLLSQYDILKGLILIAGEGMISDERASEAFNIVISKQNRDGTWNLENAATGMIHGNEKRPPLGKKNKLVTLEVMRLFKYADL